MPKFLILSFMLLQNAWGQTPVAELTPLKVKPGQVIKITMPHTDNFFPSTAYCGRDNILFERDKDLYYFFFAPSYFSTIGFKIECGFKDKNNIEKMLVSLEIVDGGFAEEKLTVDPSKVSFSKKSLKLIARDRKILNKLYRAPVPNALFKDAFVRPMDSVLTSEYGGRRLFNGHKAGQHLGSDFRAPVGTEVRATNDGKIVLNRDLFFTGYTVIIDHGLGIFSMYGHLSKLTKKEGQTVKKGDVIALSGATGRVSGPHLHWGVKMNNNWINPISLVEATAP